MILFFSCCFFSFFKDTPPLAYPEDTYFESAPVYLLNSCSRKEGEGFPHRLNGNGIFSFKNGADYTLMSTAQFTSQLLSCLQLYYDIFIYPNFVHFPNFTLTRLLLSETYLRLAVTGESTFWLGAELS